MSWPTCIVVKQVWRLGCWANVLQTRLKARPESVSVLSCYPICWEPSLAIDLSDFAGKVEYQSHSISFVTKKPRNNWIDQKPNQKHIYLYKPRCPWWFRSWLPWSSQKPSAGQEPGIRSSHRDAQEVHARDATNLVRSNKHTTIYQPTKGHL